MFTTIIVRPIFNLLVFINAILPGHDFGLSIIIFTIVIRLLMWPLVRKQLKQAKAMRELQPELKRIKASAKGDKQKESKMVMELYKEREVSPFGSIGTLIVQLVILLGLYSGLEKVVFHSQAIVSFSYPFLHNLSWIKQLTANPSLFHSTLLGLVNLNKAAIGKGGIYWPAMIIVIGSAISQYYQSKQLMPSSENSRSLRSILKEAGSGKQTDQGEVNAAVTKSTRFFLPVVIFIFTVSYPSALSLYWLVSGLVAYIQQTIVLREDVNKLEETADQKASKDVSKVPEAEVVEEKAEQPKQEGEQSQKTKTKSKAAKKKGKRRKK